MDVRFRVFDFAEGKCQYGGLAIEFESLNLGGNGAIFVRPLLDKPMLTSRNDDAPLFRRTTPSVQPISVRCTKRTSRRTPLIRSPRLITRCGQHSLSPRQSTEYIQQIEAEIERLQQLRDQVQAPSKAKSSLKTRSNRHPTNAQRRKVQGRRLAAREQQRRSLAVPELTQQQHRTDILGDPVATKKAVAKKIVAKKSAPTKAARAHPDIG